MTIETHTLRDDLLENISPDQILYSNDRVGSLVKNLDDALNYIFATIYPNYIGSYATVSALPTTATANQYAFVVNDGAGFSAGYIWISLDGSSGWQKRLDVNWSVDNVLSDLISQTNPLYVFAEGKPSGQVVYGGTQNNENLELHANSLNESGEIILNNTIRPILDNNNEIGRIDKRFKDLYLAGILSDGTASVTVANMLAAYNHISLTNNPHSTSYDQLINHLLTITFNGAATGSLDLSTSGNHSVTMTVVNDSHNHTKTTLPNFDSDVYTKVKAILQDNNGIYFNKNDSTQIILPTRDNITTANITDMSTPVANKILGGNSAGTQWVPLQILAALTGDVSGSATWDSTSQTLAVTTTANNIKLANVNGLNLTNISISLSVGNPTTVTWVGHNLTTGDSVYINTLGSGTVIPSINGNLIVTVLTANTFTIPVNVTHAGNAYIIPQYAQFLYDVASNTFILTRQYADITHSELGAIDANDDHAQYARINGRTGGQLVNGGMNASENLYLESTTNGTKGSVIPKSNLIPFINSTYSGGWSGLDLGNSSYTFRNIYLSGEAKGLRVENVTSLPSASGANSGRLIYNTIQDLFYYDSGVAVKPLSNTILPTILNTFSNVTSSTIDVSGVLQVGKTTSNYNWTLWNDSTSEQIFASISRVNSTQVSVVTLLPLTGSYLLKGI